MPLAKIWKYNLESYRNADKNRNEMFFGIFLSEKNRSMHNGTDDGGDKFSWNVVL